MRTSMNVHLTNRSRVTGAVVTDGCGRRYVTLDITDDGVCYPSITFFPADPCFLDKLANECERVVREYVGDVPVAGDPMEEEVSR